MVLLFGNELFARQMSIIDALDSGNFNTCIPFDICKSGSRIILSKPP